MAPDPSNRRPQPDESLEGFARRVRGRVGDRRALAELNEAAAAAFDVLEAAGVGARLLKGAALARLLYRPDEHRAYADVDLLVAPSDLDAARHALAGLGYENASARLGIDDVAGILHAEVWRKPGRLPNDELVIDLHWRLAGARAEPQAAWEALSRSPGSVGLERRSVPTLSRPGLALHLATHVAQHGAGEAKPVEDLTRGLERWPAEVWRQARALADEVDATRAFGTGLRLVAGGAQVARELDVPATGALEWEVANRRARPRGTFHLQALADADTVGRRVAVLRHSLFPRRDWIVRRHHWAGRGRLWLAAAYATHLLRAPLWATRAWRFRRRATREA